MSIGKIINDYGKNHSPYMRNLVNHLPMGQLALYKLTGSLEYVDSYSREYIEKTKINLVQEEHPVLGSLEESVGKRELYESALSIIKKEINHENIHICIRDILSLYDLGMSSGLFHTLIRLAYAVEGYSLDKSLIDEVARALAYYVTAYREANLFTRHIPAGQIVEAMNEIRKNTHINDLLDTYDSLGQRIRALYNDEEYMGKSFVIQGNEEEKIKALLELLIPVYLDSKNIVALHTITGLHALLVLKDYFDNFERAIDIFTSCVITHLIAVENIRYGITYTDHTELSWDCLIFKGAQSPDVHAIKLTYSCYELYKLYNIPELKDCALKRIKYR